MECLINESGFRFVGVLPVSDSLGKSNGLLYSSLFTVNGIATIIMQLNNEKITKVYNSHTNTA